MKAVKMRAKARDNTLSQDDSEGVGRSGLPLKEAADSINHALRLPIR